MKIWSLQTAVVLAAAAILALGILRLAQDEPLRTGATSDQAAGLAGCLPIVEVPATTAVSILTFWGCRPSAAGRPALSISTEVRPRMTALRRRFRTARRPDSAITRHP